MTPNSASRIDGIDFWRGFALLTIFINHLPTNVFQYVTHKNFGLSDAAELFVFLSGVSVAVAYGAKFFAGDSGKAVKAVLRRAFTLYWVQTLIAFLTIAMFAAAAAWWDNDDLIDDESRDFVVSEPGKGILAILMLGHQLENINILPMYIVLLLLTPLLLVLARRDDRLMLLASGLIYLVARVFDFNMPSWPFEGGWYFNPLAWQLLFAVGLFVGRRVRGNGIGYDGRLYVACCSLLAVSAFVVTDGFGFVPALWQDVRGFIDHDKNNLGVVRLAHFLALAYVIQHSGLTDLLRRTVAFVPLALIGRYSLPVFATGTVLAALGEVIVETRPEEFTHQIALGTAIVCAGILVHYAVARLFAARAVARRAEAPVAAQ